MTPPPRFAAAAAIALSIGTSLAGVACAPTVRLKVDPIQIYAKLDADVRIRLDEELRALLQENPNLF